MNSPKSKSTGIEILPVSPHDLAIRKLIGDLDRLQAGLYPEESNHLDSVDTLLQGNVFFVGACLDDRWLGCGGVKVMPGGYGEIKRLFVSPQARGYGLAKKMVAALENYLREKNIRVVRLETGVLQKEAINLYEQMGYRQVSPFGDYQPDPLSVFMEKTL